MTTGLKGEGPRRRAVGTTSLIGAAAWTGTCVGVITAVIVLEGRLASLCAFVVVAVGYTLHVWQSGYRAIVAAVLLVPSGFFGLGAVFEAQDGDVTAAAVIVGVSAPIAWGTLAIAIWVRNRWGDAHNTVLDIF